MTDIELLRFGDDGPAVAGAGAASSGGFGSGKRRWAKDVVNSFKPIHHDGMRYPSIDATSPWPSTRFYNLKSATIDAASPNLATKLKGRHLQMIAFGGSIGRSSLSYLSIYPSIYQSINRSSISFTDKDVGAGLFVASGKALYMGGPAALLMAVVLVGAMLLCTCEAMSELAVAFPVAGSFSSWATRFVDPSWGFALGWK
jgi:amino acid permease